MIRGTSYHSLGWCQLMLVDAGCQYCQARLKDLSKHLLNDGKQAGCSVDILLFPSRRRAVLGSGRIRGISSSDARWYFTWWLHAASHQMSPGILQAHSLRDRRPARSSQGQVAKEPLLQLTHLGTTDATDAKEHEHRLCMNLQYQPRLKTRGIQWFKCSLLWFFA